MNERKIIIHENRNLILILILVSITLPSYAELAENDISQIREVIRAEIQPLEGKIGQLETRGNLEQKVATIEAKMATKDDIAIIR